MNHSHTTGRTNDIGASAQVEGDARGIPLRWLDGHPPARLPAGTRFGVPLERGRVHDPDQLAVHDEDATAVPAHFWPLATWPDGTVKWAGVALPAGIEPRRHYRLLNGGGQARPGPMVRVAQDTERISIDTGELHVVVPRTGPDLLGPVSIGGRVIASGAQLVSHVQTQPEPDHCGREHAVGTVASVSVEQAGPVRAVVRIDGAHPRADGRTWLPFTVRLEAHAGARTFRLTHSFVYDGEPDTDFLAALGLRFAVPLRAAPYDRHIRLAGAGSGFLREAVQGLTGLRRDPGSEVRAAQMDGRPTPPQEQWDAEVPRLLRWVPCWSDYSLRQLSPGAFGIAKRTASGRPWIDIAHGTRSAGFAYLGDPGGGLGVGMTGFWQSYPTGIDIRDATTQDASLTVWMWSPDAPPMDLRFYHDGLGQQTYPQQLEALEITYEDYEPGLGNAHGIARTHEFDVVAYPHTPDLETLAGDAAHAVQRPRLVPEPAALAAAGVLGDWSLPDLSTAGHAELEDRLDRLIDFYLQQVDERGWYGFWDYGDVMHGYDFDRHTWKYDVGGYAWDNSELATDLWLWTTFLRTGRADVFRLAEAMCRHTGDVDVYHAGPYRGLGTRHNVQHWGCSAKQVRIGSPAFRRAHYFLTGDERSRDLMLELSDSDRALAVLEPTRKLHGTDGAQPLDPRRLRVGLGTDWGAWAATWLANWEIDGDLRSRDRLLGTMADIAAFPHGFLHGSAYYDLERGRFVEPVQGVSVSHLSAIFGLAEICSELIDLLDVPGFEEAWIQYCRLYLSAPEEQIAELGSELVGNLFPQWHSRLLAYAARASGDEEMAARAWQAFHAGGEATPMALRPSRRIEPPEVLQPVTELRTSTNDAAQSSLATIQNLALIGDRLPEYLEQRARLSGVTPHSI